jgi:hypothetical protein
VSEMPDRIRREIRERLVATRAAVREHGRLEAALDALSDAGSRATHAVKGRGQSRARPRLRGGRVLRSSHRRGRGRASVALRSLSRTARRAPLGAARRALERVGLREPRLAGVPLVIVIPVAAVMMTLLRPWSRPRCFEHDPPHAGGSARRAQSRARQWLETSGFCDSPQRPACRWMSHSLGTRPDTSRPVLRSAMAALTRRILLDAPVRNSSNGFLHRVDDCVPRAEVAQTQTQRACPVELALERFGREGDYAGSASMPGTHCMMSSSPSRSRAESSGLIDDPSGSSPRPMCRAPGSRGGPGRAVHMRDRDFGEP